MGHNIQEQIETMQVMFSLILGLQLIIFSLSFNLAVNLYLVALRLEIFLRGDLAGHKAEEVGDKVRQQINNTKINN